MNFGKSISRFFGRFSDKGHKAPAEVCLERLCMELFTDVNRERLPKPGKPPIRFPVATSRSSQCPIHPQDKPVNLAVATINTFNKRSYYKFSKSQRSAIDSLGVWFDNNDVTSCSVAQVNQCILLLSRAFFLKDLWADFVRFEKHSFDRDADGHPEGFGSSRHDQNGEAVIRVDPADWHDFKRVKDHKTAQLSTLFHECVHAYFQLYCCSHRHDNRGCLRHGRPLWRPGSGHDIGWFHLAAGLELAVNKHFELEVDLSVFRSLLREYEKEEAPRYSSGEWAQFFKFFSWKGVDSLVRKLKEDEFRDLVHFLKDDPDALAVIAVFGREYVKARKRGLLHE